MWLRFIFFFIMSFMLNLPSISFAKNYGRNLCDEEGFECIKIKRGQSWQTLWPDETERDIVMRINRMNTSLYPGQIIAVPDNLTGANALDFAPFAQQRPSSGEKLLIFDPTLQAWGAYDADGTLLRWGPASGGKSWCGDIGRSCHTKAGTFRIYSLGSSGCISHKFPIEKGGGAHMPYCMFFHGGFAFHGSANGLPGYHASHGCVRLYVDDAEWLRYDFVDGPDAYNSYRGTKVIVRPYYQQSEDDDE